MSMDGVPRPVFEARSAQVTALTCPDCAGSLSATLEGRGTLRFVCRVGHAMSVTELIAGKEEKIEGDLWAAVRELDELASLLADVEMYRDRLADEVGGPHTGRIRAARADADRLRAMIEKNRSVTFSGTGHAPRRQPEDHRAGDD